MTASDEFRITGVKIGDSADAELHESMLNNPEAEAMSDLLAINQALRTGMDIQDAVRLYAGDLARKRLIADGILTISPADK